MAIFQVLGAANVKMAAFWNTGPCILVGVDRRVRVMMKQFAPLKRRQISTRLHGATFLYLPRLNLKSFFVVQLASYF
jgi:hypothetical protein